MRILRLPVEVANQIAAGEVIERPASVVKELLENAYDAGADSISIDIGFGGLNQIVVSDNGHGIMAEDLHLSIASHATSKIRQLKDLEAIHSLGFRGEALASIASISRLSIRSKTADQEMGMMLMEQQGEHVLKPVARTKGTSIEVKDIFYNAPVRKKFLKSERVEFLAIDTIVRRFALSAPGVAIELSHNGKPCLQLTKAQDAHSQALRMSKVLGKAFSDEAIPVDIEQASMRLYGWISGSDYQRSQNDKLWIYINGRMVRDKLLNHALKQAYEQILHPGRNPACLLYLTINPEWVDVNVHPTKHEVRFQEPRLVHDFISVRLKELLNPRDALSSSAYELREPVFPEFKTRKPDYKALDRRMTSPPAWFSLNAHFSLLRLDNEPYLVHMISLQKAFLKNTLEKAQLPLAKRPMLVAVHASLHGSRHGFEALKEALCEIGIDLKWVSTEQCLIQSLPVLIPHVDLQAFFTACCQSDSLSVKALLECLIEKQSANPELQESYEQYLQSLDIKDCNFIKHLTLKNCEDFCK